MGFKNLQYFNISMLGKMAWKFITDSQSHVVQIYKTRYFPHYSFMEANLGANPSYKWCSTLEAKQIVRLGSHIRIGDGKNTNKWGDPWFPSAENGIINSNTQPGVEEAKVSGLMKVNERVWDLDVLRDLFSKEDVKRIQQIPLSHRDISDIWLWIHDSIWIFTVKSFYRLL